MIEYYSAYQLTAIGVLVVTTLYALYKWGL